MNSPVLEKFEIPAKELPKVMDNPEFTAVSSYMFQRCKSWTEIGVPRTVCTTKHVPSFDGVASSLYDIYNDMHTIFLPRSTKRCLHISSYPDPQQERKEYGYLSVIFCDADLMLKLSGAWYTATKDQAQRGIVIPGALDPILPAIAYKCVGRPTLLVSFSLEPGYTCADTKKAYHNLLTTPRDARCQDAGPNVAFDV